jgi:hypothetical protein
MAARYAGTFRHYRLGWLYLLIERLQATAC